VEYKNTDLHIENTMVLMEAGRWEKVDEWVLNYKED
jgi:hypothetical protein